MANRSGTEEVSGIGSMRSIEEGVQKEDRGRDSSSSLRMYLLSAQMWDEMRIYKRDEMVKWRGVGMRLLNCRIAWDIQRYNRMYNTDGKEEKERMVNPLRKQFPESKKSERAKIWADSRTILRRGSMNARESSAWSERWKESRRDQTEKMDERVWHCERVERKKGV